MNQILPLGVSCYKIDTPCCESQKLNEAERRYTASQKEMLAVVHCLRAWRQYFLGVKFMVKTDNSICHFFNQPKLSSEQTHWQECVAEFDFQCEHKQGKANHYAIEKVNM